MSRDALGGQEQALRRRWVGLLCPIGAEWRRPKARVGWGRLS